MPHLTSCVSVPIDLASRGDNNQYAPRIVGNPEMLRRLRSWAEPLIGEISEPYLLALQEIIESAAALPENAGVIPRYRATDD